MVDGACPKKSVPHLNQCFSSPLTEQEERLVSILEILQIERHVPRTICRYRYPGRKPFDRQALARAFVAKAIYRHPTTSDSHRALQSAVNLRRISGFATTGDIPSESTFSRAVRPNASINSSIGSLRKRARFLCHSNPLARGGRDSSVSNLIGTDISPTWELDNSEQKEELPQIWVDSQQELEVMTIIAAGLTRGGNSPLGFC